MKATSGVARKTVCNWLAYLNYMLNSNCNCLPQLNWVSTPLQEVLHRNKAIQEVCNLLFSSTPLFQPHSRTLPSLVMQKKQPKVPVSVTCLS